MTDKPTKPKNPKNRPAVSHSGMMGDGTQEQNLGERGNPASRIKKSEVDAAFAKKIPQEAVLSKAWHSRGLRASCVRDWSKLVKHRPHGHQPPALGRRDGLMT